MLQKLINLKSVAPGKTRAAVIIGLVLLSLLSLGALTAFGDDSLHRAAYNGNIDRVKEILLAGVDPDERDSFGGTALHAAMFQKNTEIVTLLINNGLDVNAQGTSNGYTPLHDAIWANNLPAAKLLIAAGAVPDIKNNEGQSALEKAQSEGKEELADLLKSVEIKSSF